MPLLIPFVIFGGEAKGDVSPPNFGEVDLLLLIATGPISDG